MDEGQSVSVSGTFTYQVIGVPTESFTGTTAWSDGVMTPSVIDPTTGTFSTSRSFPDDDPSGRLTRSPSPPPLRTTMVAAIQPFHRC
jgi:hypothetical protein